MAAEALGVGDAEEGEQRRGLLDPVDIAVDREVEDGAADDLRHADEHQEEDGERRDQVEAVFGMRQGPIGPTEQYPRRLCTIIGGHSAQAPTGAAGARSHLRFLPKAAWGL